VDFLLKITKRMRDIASIALTFMLLVTMADVIGRAVWKPVKGAYEIVSMTGAVVLVFAIPLTSWEKGHVYMEFIVDRLSVRAKDALNILTRAVGVLLFIVIGFGLFTIASELKEGGEISVILKIPMYPLVYAIGIVSFIHCSVSILDIIRILKDRK
jgi:TRAP-type C4-dicarboxylate transport system permease small subunit